ncbi:hypothetical protein [Chryseobacterium sp.]|uniref:hypothetical protein n=1 Tax=Chryseobacterium sp. TaxID=1871047 RepID=UPI0011CC98B2|nr:hypothetical protein [Chryseobacterium sp.]TXF78884.1 hypothetical protein FUA25_00360 [Chryseobacterium sp.]
MVRKILAVLAGLVATALVVGLVEQLGHYVYPLPSGADPNDPETFKKYAESAPFMAIFFVILAYAAGAFTGGFVSTKIANDGKKIYALIIGAVFLLISVYMMVIIPSPIWFWILGIASWGLVLVGYRLALKNNYN